jgi:hypothetical protein
MTTAREAAIIAGRIRPAPEGCVWLDRPTLRIDELGRQKAALAIEKPLPAHIAQRELEGQREEQGGE